MRLLNFVFRKLEHTKDNNVRELQTKINIKAFGLSHRLYLLNNDITNCEIIVKLLTSRLILIFWSHDNYVIYQISSQCCQV